MKMFPLAIGCAGLLALGGCETSASLTTPLANQARDMLTEHCEVGRVRSGTPTVTWHVRVAKGTRQQNNLIITSLQRIDPDRIELYNVKEHPGGWVEFDAVTGKARDNFYFKPDTGEAVCSFFEWGGPTQINVGGSSKTKPSMNSVIGH